MSAALNLQAERKAFEAAAGTLNIPPTSMAGFELWLAARSAPKGALTDALPEHEVICMAVKIGQTYPSINAATSESLILFARAIEARNQQGVLTDAQIAAGAAILCDHGTPIGRNAAISVYDAMGGSRGGDALDAARYRVIRDSADATFDAAVWIVTDSGARINVTSGTRSELDRMADAAIEQRKTDKKGTV